MLLQFIVIYFYVTLVRFELTFPIGIEAVNTLPYFSKNFGASVNSTH